MRENYSCFNYWESLINKSKTVRAHQFMEVLPTEKSFYFHTLIFGKKNGIKNMWGYVPDIRSLIGYIQHSFLQEAFYGWIYGQEKLITKIPCLSVDKIILEAQKLNKVSKEIASKMRKDYEILNKMWDMPTNKAKVELIKFLNDFNKKWMGDSSRFLYIRFFETPEELGEFVISSSLMTSTEQELENKIGVKIEEWRNVCKLGAKDNAAGEKFREILLKRLTEVF